MRTKVTNLMTTPGTNPMPLLNAAVNRAKENSELTEVSNIQMMKGISKNMNKPLPRCNMETIAATVMRYVGKSLKALMLRNSGRLARVDEVSSDMEGLSVGNRV